MLLGRRAMEVCVSATATCVQIAQVVYVRFLAVAICKLGQSARGMTVVM